MQSNYLIVNKCILPSYYEKVIEARAMLESGAAKDVSTAARACGISRSTYYKYKDYVFSPSEDSVCKKVIISFSLSHEAGRLGEVLGTMSKYNENILTITQNLPIGGQAHVVLSFDSANMSISSDELISIIEKIPGTGYVKLVAIE
ncbi:MAG: ACT domain-containing protein [Eubacteriales bacterium]|nr:ACT domain-containing protein [Eubacteriales bacterium]